MLLKSLHVLRIVAQPKTFLVGTVLAIATSLAAAALGTSTQIHQLGRGHVRWITALARPFHPAARPFSASQGISEARQTFEWLPRRSSASLH